jgi:hypothetical protein
MRSREKRSFLAGAGVRVRIGGGAILPSQTLRTRHVLSYAEVLSFSTVALLHVSTEEFTSCLIWIIELFIERISVSVALSPLVLAFVKIRQVTDVRSFWATAHVTTRFLSDINRFSAALGLIAQIDFRFPPRAGRSCPPLAHRLRLGLLLISPRCLNRSGESTQTDDRMAATATAEPPAKLLAKRQQLSLSGQCMRQRDHNAVKSAT